MNKNVCIILLMFLIVYLIYKISSNSCDCFSVGGNQKCSDYPIGGCLGPCEWNDSTQKCEQKKRRLIPDDPSQFIANINKAYNASNSNGVFISIIVEDGMDGSGSVLNNNIYTTTYLWNEAASCGFGFIWDTNWLTANDGSLVECLFPLTAGTAYFNDTDCESPNFCELANTSGSNTPDRCSHGLFVSRPDAAKLPYPTSCKQNKIYNFIDMNREELENDENCFTYINRKINKSNKSYVNGFNEGVFLKDLNNTNLNYHEGFEKLNELKKPLPSALLLLYSDNVDCTNNVNYINTLKAIKSSFTSDTMVVKAKYDNENKSIISFDDHTTLGEIS